MKLDGREIADKLYDELKERVQQLKKKKITPHLVVFLVGEHPASVAYVTLKQRKGEEIGAKVTLLQYPTTITTEELEEKINLLNIDPFVHGILIQRPLPEHIDVDRLEQITNPQKDIDGFHPKSPYTLPLPLAVVRILEEVYHITRQPDLIAPSPELQKPVHESFAKWLQSQKIVLLGKGPTGGGPIIAYLEKLKVNVQLIDSKTKNPEKLIKLADIIITAVGRKYTIKPTMLKKGVVLISVGINRGDDGKLHGDYDEARIKDIASYYTSTPGGVGPVNVAMLLQNILTAAEKASK